MIKFDCNPCEVIRITSKYGYRKHPITDKKQFHKGIDIGKSHDHIEPIFCVSDGVVIDQGWTSIRGNYVIIQHDGFATLYQHLHSYLSKYKRFITAGQLFAYMGSTGQSTGVHLHFELYKGNYKDKKHIDPQLYLRKE